MQEPLRRCSTIQLVAVTILGAVASAYERAILTLAEGGYVELGAEGRSGQAIASNHRQNIRYFNDRALFSLAYRAVLFTQLQGDAMPKQILFSVSLLASCAGLAAIPTEATARETKIVVPWQKPAGLEVPASCAVPDYAELHNTFYIDPVHGSASGDGSAAHPWNSLNTVTTLGYISTMPGWWNSTTKRMVNVMPNAPIHPGDVILLESGNYGNVLIQGFFGASNHSLAGYDNSDFITIQAAPGATPVLGNLLLDGGGKWVFRGLTFENIAPNLNSRAYGSLAAFTGPHHDIIFDSNTLSSQADISGWTQADWRGNAASGIDDYGGIYNGATCVTMTNNAITNVSFGISTQRSDKVLIKGNTVNYFLHTAIPHGSNDLVIRNNLMANRIDAGDVAEFHPQFMRGSPWGSFSPTVDHLSNVVIDSNIGIRQTDPNLPFTGPDMSGTMGFDNYNGFWTNVQVTNNVVITNTWQGISYFGTYGLVIANNTLLSDGSTPAIPWITLGTSHEGGVPGNTIIRNNITTTLAVASSSSIVVDHNLCVPTNGKCTVVTVNSKGETVWNNNPGTYGDDNVVGQYGAPSLFNNFTSLPDGTVTGLDLRLKPGTPAVRTGDAVDAPATDITGATRRVPYDLGAYKYGDTSAPTLAR